MEYHSLSTLHPGRVAMFAVLLIMAALVIMAALPSCIAQTGQTNLKDTSTHNSCLSENGRLAVDRGTPCSQPEIAILVSGNNKMGLSLAPIVGPKTTPEEARKQFEDGARRGYAPAEVNLGVLYAYGWGVPQNLGTALYWIGLAADQGNVQALADLGIFYRNGWGVRQDQPRAVHLFQTAAQAGDTGAMTNLGYAYNQGLGVAKSQQIAADWYRKAADRGNATGQNNLADMYLRGEGVPPDDKTAFELFSKAAVQGNTAACIKLGYMYMTGRATAKDPETAYMWIKSASISGDQRGAEYLNSLSSKLSSAQLKRANERARNLQGHSATVQQASVRP